MIFPQLRIAHFKSSWAISVISGKFALILDHSPVPTRKYIITGAPTGTRTRVLALKGPRPNH